MRVLRGFVGRRVLHPSLRATFSPVETGPHSILSETEGEQLLYFAVPGRYGNDNVALARLEGNEGSPKLIPVREPDPFRLLAQHQTKRLQPTDPGSGDHQRFVLVAVVRARQILFHQQIVQTVSNSCAAVRAMNDIRRLPLVGGYDDGEGDGPIVVALAADAATHAGVVGLRRVRLRRRACRSARPSSLCIPNPTDACGRIPGLWPPPLEPGWRLDFHPPRRNWRMSPRRARTGSESAHAG